jgi:lipopolysaccharide transport system ATP-binding protein
MAVAISVENLSKQYIIGHQPRERYTALRDVLANGAKRFAHKVTHPFAKPEDDATHETFWALKDINFTIEQGDRVGIIGRNGAGKSTLLKILSRITEPTSGRIKIRGRVSSLLEVGTGFHPELTGRENIFLNGAILGMGKAEITRKFDEIVAFAEVEKFLDTPVKRYSSGMYVRLAFAVAAHLEPEILIVDEVLAVGDAQFQKKCLGKMEDVGKEGRTVLFVSHNMGTISALCNKGILLESGKVICHDKIQTAISKYNYVADRAETIEIHSRMRNRSDGSINFKNCSLFSLNREPRVAFYIGEDLRVEIGLTSAFTGKMSFWIIIYDVLRTPLLSSFQWDQEFVEMRPGEYTLVYETRGLALMPGDYTITAGAFGPELRSLEWIDNCQSFEVHPSFSNGKAFDGRWGAVNQLATWKLEAQLGGKASVSAVSDLSGT